VSAHEAVCEAVNTQVKDAKQAAKISDAVFTALDSGGWLTTDNDHLAMMRTTLQVIHKAVMDPETARKDISPLTRRLQDLSALVTTLEEKERGEARIRRGSTNTNGASAAKFDNSKI
jgi:hypothetical protein